VRLAKIRALFLSPSFYPQSPVSSYWDAVHVHVPPATFSGILLRAILFAFNPRLLYGDYIPCEPGVGLLVKVKRGGAEIIDVEWAKAGRGEVRQGFKPPYIEYHFRAVALGAYPESVLRGYAPRVGYASKYWNVIKYVDARDEHLLAPLVVGIKTWHFTILDGARVDGRQYQTYEVVKVRHVVHLEDVYGFALVDDPVVARCYG